MKEKGGLLARIEQVILTSFLLGKTRFSEALFHR